MLPWAVVTRGVAAPLTCRGRIHSTGKRELTGVGQDKGELTLGESSLEIDLVKFRQEVKDNLR